MADQVDGSAVQVPVVAQNADASKQGAENVGINQAINRMLQSEQAKESAANTPTDPVLQAEEANTTPPVTDAADVSSVETEATESTEVEPPDAEADPVLSNDGSIDPKLQELVNKRIEKRVAKEVAKRKVLESQLNELKLSVQAQAQQPPPVQAPIIPLPEGAPVLANIDDANGLNTLRSQALEAKDWAQTQLDEGSGDVQMGDKTLSERDLKAIVRNANKTLERDIPSRAQFLAQRQQVQQNAFKEFPFLNDRSSPDYVAAQSAYQAMPWLKNLPNADWIIGVQIEGLKALQAKKQIAEKKAPKPSIAPKAPASQVAVSTNGTTSRVAVGTRNQQEISAIRMGQSRKGGITANEAIAALTKIEQLNTR